jgi:protein associated with RNAse G/E
MFKKAKGDIYNNSLQFIESDFDIRVVDLNKIKPVDPDPKLQKEKMEAYYKKLKEELASLEAEMNRI